VRFLTKEHLDKGKVGGHLATCCMFIYCNFRMLPKHYFGKGNQMKQSNNDDMSRKQWEIHLQAIHLMKFWWSLPLSGAMVKAKGTI